MLKKILLGVSTFVLGLGVLVAATASTPIPVPTNTPTLTPTSVPTATPTPVRRACVENIKWGTLTLSNLNYGNLTQAECQAKVN